MENPMTDGENLSLQMLRQGDVEKIHEASLAILEGTGVMMNHPRALEVLSGIGCSVTGEGMVRFPREVVEDAIKKAPPRLDVYTRDGDIQMSLEERNVYYGTVTSLPFMAEPDDSRRPYTLDDCREMTIIMDALPSLDFATATGNCSDVPVEVSDVHEIACVLEHSPKPILMTTHDSKGLQALIDIAKVCAGGRDAFIQKPFFIFCTSPISPLKYSTDSLDKMILAVEQGLPFLPVPAPMAGGTTPVTLAGTLVTSNAEILAGLVLTQALRSGSAFLYGGFFTVMDMQNMIMTHGSPEFNLLNVAQTELARYYGVPSFSSAGCTDSHAIDGQTAFEAGFSTLVTGLCGANLVHAFGVLGSGTAVSKELLVLGDEVITYAKRFLQGIRVDEKHLAVDEIERVGCGGNFLDTEMTLSLFKKEHWYPKCFVRSQFDNWFKEGDARSLQARLGQRCKTILSEHKPAPLSDAKLSEIRKIVERSDEERLSKA